MYFIFLPKTVYSRISWESTLVAYLMEIVGRLPPVHRSARFVCQTHPLTHDDDNVPNAYTALDKLAYVCQSMGHSAVTNALIHRRMQ